MTVQITIRDVGDEISDELAARAALKHQSMQEYLRQALDHMASRPTVETLLAEARRRVEASGTVITSEMILEARDADRR